MKHSLLSKVYFLLILSTIISFNAIAQERGQQGQRRFDPSMMQPIGKISGTVIDAQTNEPIEYANIVMYRWRDSTVANGIVSDTKGNFEITKVMPGRYFMKVSYIGYATKRFDSLTVTPQNSSFSFSVKLNPKNVNMNEIVVKSEKEATQYNLDKKVYNVDKSLANSGVSAVEVVQNIPAVQVDVDGQVSVRGNTNITVLVDGRPAQLAGFSGSDVLAQIPASQIESIELVTNPSAKYDPEGTGGIINVILKKKSNLGVNGTAMANAGTLGRYNTSLNVNLRGDDFNLFGSYDGRFFNMNGGGQTTRNSSYNSPNGIVNNTLDQLSSSRNKSYNHGFNIGGDYYLAEKEYFSLNGNIRLGSFDSYSKIDNKNILQATTIQSYFERLSDADRDNSSGNYTLSYKKNYTGNSEEITADLMYSGSSMDNNSINKQNYFDTGMGAIPPNSTQKALSNSSNDMLLAQANYVKPLNSWGRIETGFKSIVRDLKMANDYFDWNISANNWGASILERNSYDYKEQIHAVYGIYSNSFGAFSFQTGLRAEQAIIDGTIETLNQTFTAKYFEVYPTVHLRYAFSELDELTLSYSRRIDRPRNNQLNPYRDRTDSLNIFYGNPNLRPQNHNSLELGLSKFIGKTMLMSNLFYRQNDNLISTITKLNPVTQVTESTYENVSKGVSYGVEVIGSHTINDWWRVNESFSYYNNSVDDLGTLGSSRSADSWRVMLNSQMTLWEGFSIQSMIFYNSPSIQLMIGGFGGGMGGGRGGGGGMGGGFEGGGMFGGSTAQTKIKELYWMDLSARQELMDGQLTITLRVSDLFDSRKFDTQTIGSNFDQISKRFFDSRTVNLGISFRLVNTKNKMMDQERQRRVEEGYDEL